jgi:hypothetical protein
MPGRIISNSRYGPFQAPHWCHGRTKRQCELHMERNSAPRGYHYSMFKNETFGGYGVALVAHYGSCSKLSASHKNIFNAVDREAAERRQRRARAYSPPWNVAPNREARKPKYSEFRSIRWIPLKSALRLIGWRRD